MSRTLKISLATPTPDLVHEFRNFGEELYLALRNECAISIDEIDASTREFHIRHLPKRSVRTIAARVRKIAAGYPWLSPMNVFEVPLERADGDNRT
jgi:hypothetical protein